MAKNSTGISLADAWAESAAEISAETAQEPATPVTAPAASQPDVVAEQPAGTGEGVLVALKDNAGPTPVNTPLEDVNSLEVDVKGKMVTVAELIKGYMRQDDYTKKTTETADLRKEAENALALWKSLEENPVETVRRLSQRVNLGRPVIDGAEDKQTLQGADLDELIKTKVKEALASDPDLQSTRQNVANSRVNAEFTRIEQEWGVTLTDQDKLLILDTAAKKNSTDLEFVFAGLLQLANRKAEQRKNVQNLSTATGSQGDPMGAPPKPAAVPGSWAEALEQTMQELRIEDLTRIS